MRELIFCTCILTLFLSGCEDSSEEGNVDHRKLNGHILTDDVTGKKYVVKSWNQGLAKLISVHTKEVTK